jgi:hypothetical protein
MILRIVGINHFDPAERQSLSEWLARCAEAYGNPEFIAVEWDSGFHDQLRARRDEFANMLKKEWPNISESLLKTLKLSLGYDGDTHLETYAGVETLWLDEGRPFRKRVLEDYAHNRLKLYKAYLGEWPTDADDSEILLRISRGANNDVEAPPASGTPRDESFADRIAQKARKDDDGWAIVIVGKNHAADCSGSMRRLLEVIGYDCEVSYLT